MLQLLLKLRSIVIPRTLLEFPFQVAVVAVFIENQYPLPIVFLLKPFLYAFLFSHSSYFDLSGKRSIIVFAKAGESPSSLWFAITYSENNCFTPSSFSDGKLSGS